MSNGRLQSPESEILARVRRTETRVTQLCLAAGISTQAQKPEFNPAKSRVLVPSRHTTLQELLASIPKDWKNPVEVYIGSELLVTVHAATSGDEKGAQ